MDPVLNCYGVTDDFIYHIPNPVKRSHNSCSLFYATQP